MKKYLTILTMSIIVFSCSQQDEAQPEIIDARQEMLDVMKFTAQAVSEISVNPNVKKELLSYGLQEFDGEVTAHFSKLLHEGNPEAVSSNNSKGTFSRLFENKALEFESNQLNNKSQSADNTITDLEAFLKDKNMALYGPYLAENHANSDKPLTVSFDPLDGSKTSNIGYILVPKTSSGSTANSGGLDAPNAIPNYDVVEISGVDDDYAYNNPTLFVIIDDAGSSGGGSSSSNNPPPGNNRDIDCRTLTTDDIVLLKMPEFRLLDNFSWAPWDRNFISLWVATGQLTFSDGVPVLGANVNQHMGRKQISRENGRKREWLNSDIPHFESKWDNSEVELFYVFTRKESSKISITGKVGYNKDGLNVSVDVNVGEQDKEKIITKQNLDRCLYLARHTRDLGFGTRNGEAIYRFDKLEFYLQPDISNIND